MTTNGDSHMDEYIRTNKVISHKRSKWLRERKLSTKHYWNESLSSGKSGNDDGSRLVNIGAPLKNDNITIIKISEMLTEKDDFIFEIEPSKQGGQKIANKIMDIM